MDSIHSLPTDSNELPPILPLIIVGAKGLGKVALEVLQSTDNIIYCFLDEDYKEEAAEALKLTAKDMLKNKLIDKIIDEPLGGAHYNPSEAYNSVKENILSFTKKIRSLSKDKMIESRRKKFTKIGNFKG